jgi:hypothetical protein
LPTLVIPQSAVADPTKQWVPKFTATAFATRKRRKSGAFVALSDQSLADHDAYYVWQYFHIGPWFVLGGKELAYCMQVD